MQEFVNWNKVGFFHREEKSTAPPPIKFICSALDKNHLYCFQFSSTYRLKDNERWRVLWNQITWKGTTSPVFHRYFSFSFQKSFINFPGNLIGLGCIKFFKVFSGKTLFLSEILQEAILIQFLKSQLKQFIIHLYVLVKMSNSTEGY